MRITSRLRGFTALAVSAVFVLSTALGASGAAPAQASTPPAPAGTQTTAPHSGSRDAQLAQQHYKPAGCNTQTAAQLDSATPKVHCFAMGLTNANGTLAVRAAAPPSTALTPTDLQNAYDLPDGGAGMTVAIVDALGYTNAESDLAVFRDYYGLPACTTANGCFRKVDQDGGTNYPPQDGGWSVETALDLDAVSSVCPKCNLLLVQASTTDSSDLGQSANTAAALGANVISNSYGLTKGEDPAETQYDSYYDHPGVAVVASTGDTGNVNEWPATSDNVTAVGGTLLTRDGSSRGWTESAWSDGGSGCSPYEPRPDYQNGLSTNCPDGKATADISADADPASGIGVYNTLGQSGWAQWGGTSLSAPLVAGMYALAGPATPNTYPVSYPYRDVNQAKDLNDVTRGNNGSCGNVLCQTGTGWDGPTGLGTPHGVAALSQGEHGDIVGTVTDSSSGDPISGVTVSAAAADGTTYHATTDAKGSYDVAAATGSYDLTLSKYGYSGKSMSGVAVTKNVSVTEDFTLTAQPTDTVSGTVADGSGHGWPMYAKITIDGYPNGAVYTDPYTGRYSVALPKGSTYTMHVTSAELPGYTSKDVTVDLTGSSSATRTSNVKPGHTQLLDANATQNVELTVDSSSCTAPGYAYADTGLQAEFTGWTGKTPQDGWTITDGVGNGQTWVFDNPGGWAPPAGDADFADIDSDNYGQGGSQDSSLVSPVVDLAGQDNPEIGFDSTYIGFPGQTGDVDLSLDGGKTWSTVHEMTGGLGVREDLSIPQAAGKSDVQVRFHFTGSWSRRWEVDNVLIGGRTCAPTPGGLMAGVVTDGNTKAPLNGATVASNANQTDFGVTMPTPDDANLSDGYYWLFSSHTGSTKFTVTDGRYTAKTASATVPADSVLHRNWKLGAGHLTVDKHSISLTEQLGATKSRTITFGNDGTAPVHVKLSEEDGGFTAMDGTHQATSPGAPAQLVRTKLSYAAVPDTKSGLRAKPGAAAQGPTAQVNGHKVALRQASPADGPWTDIADYPTGILDDAVAYHDGKVYVVGGSDGGGALMDANVYDPTTKAWTALAHLPEWLNGPVAQFIGGTLYVAGGWDGLTNVTTHAYSYDPSADVWTRLADLPAGAAMAGSAVVGGQLYVVAGCADRSCTGTSSVYSYSPDSGEWTQQPDYPQPTAYLSCGGAAGEIVCAGGVDSSSGASTTSTYAYTPGASAWQQRADLPVDAWGASSSSANGKVQVFGGAINNGAGVTNQAFEYDPQSDQWTALPNSNTAEYRGGGACGIYQVGGANQSGALALAQTLPGYGSCNGDADLPWLSENTTGFGVAPGASVTVRVSMDSSVVAQPGDYLGLVDVSTDTPYASASISATMQVTPPKSWGKLAGTVDGSSGSAIAGATVQVCTMYNTRTGTCGPQSYTLKTDAHGNYQLWLSKDYNPLEIIAAMQGYQPKMKIGRLHAGETTTVDFALPKI